MISNARGKHSSPGVYIEEIEKSYASKSLGVTTLGLVGETLKGPAFEPIRINNWTEFQEYFGGTSTEKFKATGYPKYELPYIAKSYLQESDQLEVCRVLGFSGYNAGKAWLINDGETVFGVIRSKATYKSSEENNSGCSGSKSGEILTFLAKNVSLSSASTITDIISGCTHSTNNIADNRYVLTVDTVDIPVSFNSNDKDYIVNVIGMSPNEGNYNVFLEEFYDLALNEKYPYGTINPDENLKLEITESAWVGNYQEIYREAITPWFVSEVKGNGKELEVNKLFRFHTISDGDAANYEVKISIANILPEEGLFDIYIRDFNDSDNSPIILERYYKCNMLPGSPNYIGLKIGTFDGEYVNKSKYVTVEVIESDVTENSVPCGFLGYPLRNYNTAPAVTGTTPDTGFPPEYTGVTPVTEINQPSNAPSNPFILKPAKLKYNTTYNEMIKPNRQYFGLSNIDIDVLKYKGKQAYSTDALESNGYSNGFHLDSRVNSDGRKITVDGKTGYNFTTPDKIMSDYSNIPQIESEEEKMSNTIYEDKRMRKFTCYPYGGFDGWDIYRNSRTNTNGYRANKYAINENTIFTDEIPAAEHGLTGRVISSDYYAYLAGYKQFDNPSKIDINLLATPGIDYVNNEALVSEVLDIVEDSRQGDCLYIVTTPDTKTDGTSIEPDEASQSFISSDINTSYAATYYPWVKYYDATAKRYINLPVTKDVVRNFAYTDNVSQPWFASAGMSRGNVDCVKATRFTKLDEEDNLYENMINPVKSFSSDGVKIWGNKTMYLEDTPLNRINVRRLMIRLKKLVMSATRQLIFEQNDNTVEAQFRSIVGSILSNAKQNRGISDYKIQTDTSAEARDRKELPARIWVKPINSLEYISISFVVTPEGANFED